MCSKYGVFLSFGSGVTCIVCQEQNSATAMFGKKFMHYQMLLPVASLKQLSVSFLYDKIYNYFQFEGCHFQTLLHGNVSVLTVGPCVMDYS